MATKPDAKEVYFHGLRFLATDGFLRQNAEKDEKLAFWAQHPSMVISTFASELFLKCLLLLEGKAAPREHNLEALFKLLSSDRQKRISELWDADQASRRDHLDEVSRKMGIAIPRELSQALHDCGDAFVLLRYLYEDPKKASFYITFLPIILRDVIREITGWKD